MRSCFIGSILAVICSFFIFGGASGWCTSIAIDLSQGEEFSRMVVGHNSHRDDGYRLKSVDISYRSSLRGVGGGLDADTYDWKDIHSGLWNGTPRPTTLDFLKECRDQQAEPVFTVNVCGSGIMHPTGTWECDRNPPEGYLETLAADWVKYTNVITQNYRQGDTLPSEYQDILDEFQWDFGEELLSSEESQTGKVIYWEIGNEPELGTIPGFIEKHYVGPTAYLNRYKSITAAMLAVDPDIKVGPCLLGPSEGGSTINYMNLLLSDPDAQVDFLSYHAYYTDLYAAWISTWDDVSSIEAALRGVKQHQQGIKDLVDTILDDNNADPNMPLMSSEWNASYWRGAYEGLGKCMTHALGNAESIFTFAELDYLATHYWDQPWIGKAGYKMFEGLEEHLGNVMVYSYADGANFRLYVTRDDDDGEVVIWGLNFSDSTDRNITLSLLNLPFSSYRITKKKLGVVGGDTSLKTPDDEIDWEVSDVTGANLGNWNTSFEDATITAYVIESAVTGVESYRDYE